MSAKPPPVRATRVCATLAVALAILSPPGAPRAAQAAAIEWQPPIDIARGAGQRGPWRQNDSDFRFVDDPTVAWGPRGDLAVAWVDQARKAVLLQRLPASSAGPAAVPAEIFGDRAAFSWLPRLAWAPDDADRLHLLWQEIIFSGGSHGGEVLSAASRDGGRSVGSALNLSQSRAGDGKGRSSHDRWENGSLDIAAAAGGRVIATWTEYDGRLWTAWSDDGGLRFSKPLLIAGEPPAPPARAPALAVGDRGLVVLAWTTGEDDAADIWIARSTDGGKRFDVPRKAAVTAGRADAPKLAFDPSGALHLVHHESPGGRFGEPVVLHQRSEDGGLRFGPAQQVSDGLAGYPSLGIDARGRVVVIWESMRRPDTLTAQGLGIAVSEDGLAFGPPGPVPASMDPGGGFNGSSQGLLMRKLAVRADGEIAIVNSALKAGSHSRVWLLRGALPQAAPATAAAGPASGAARPPR